MSIRRTLKSTMSGLACITRPRRSHTIGCPSPITPTRAYSPAEDLHPSNQPCGCIPKHHVLRCFHSEILDDPRRCNTTCHDEGFFEPVSQPACRQCCESFAEEQLLSHIEQVHALNRKLSELEKRMQSFASPRDFAELRSLKSELGALQRALKKTDVDTWACYIELGEKNLRSRIDRRRQRQEMVSIKVLRNSASIGHLHHSQSSRDHDKLVLERARPELHLMTSLHRGFTPTLPELKIATASSKTESINPGGPFSTTTPFRFRFQQDRPFVARHQPDLELDTALVNSQYAAEQGNADDVPRSWNGTPPMVYNHTAAKIVQLEHYMTLPEEERPRWFPRDREYFGNGSARGTCTEELTRSPSPSTAEDACDDPRRSDANNAVVDSETTTHWRQLLDDAFHTPIECPMPRRRGTPYPTASSSAHPISPLTSRSNSKSSSCSSPEPEAVSPLPRTPSTTPSSPITAILIKPSPPPLSTVSPSPSFPRSSSSTYSTSSTTSAASDIYIGMHDAWIVHAGRRSIITYVDVQDYVDAAIEEPREEYDARERERLRAERVAAGNDARDAKDAEIRAEFMAEREAERARACMLKCIGMVQARKEAETKARYVEIMGIEGESP